MKSIFHIFILSAVKRPYRGILAISAWYFFNWEMWNTSWTPDGPSGNSHLLAISPIRSKTRYGLTNLGANFTLTPIRLTPRRGNTWRHARSPISLTTSLSFWVYITLLPGLSYLQSIPNQLYILFWLLWSPLVQTTVGLQLHPTYSWGITHIATKLVFILSEVHYRVLPPLKCTNLP